MKVVTPEQMRQIDYNTINRIGIPGPVLMENAALKVVDEIAAAISELKDSKVFIFAGKGNNGGDALAVARHLYNKGCNVQVYLLCSRSQVSGDAGINLNIITNMGLDITELDTYESLEKLKQDIRTADLIVDGIFGIGLKGAVSGIIKDAIDIINGSNISVISIDIPSGVNGETGEILGTCIRAKTTVTFGLPKTGIVIHPGCEAAGRLVVADISIPECVIAGMDIKCNLVDGEFISQVMPQRKDNSNKGNYGRVFIISGSTGMTGAGCLAAKAALRAGAGLVYLGVPASLAHIYEIKVTETVTIPLNDDNRGYLSKSCLSEINSRMEHMNVTAVGPGLSMKGDMKEIIRNIIETSRAPLILDADALNAIAADVSVLSGLKCEAVITPHPGEMARLARISVDEVQSNRIEAARNFARQWNVITVLKGSRTITALPDGTIYINPTGNSGMATGGTGDVLTGLIAGLAAQGVALSEAAVAGVYLHGLAGDLAAEKLGEHSMTAGDLLAELPKALKKFVNSKVG